MFMTEKHIIKHKNAVNQFNKDRKNESESRTSNEQIEELTNK